MSTTSSSLLPSRNKGNYLDRCQKVNLLTNLFKVDIRDNLKVFIFALKTDPEIPRENGKKLRSIIAGNRLALERTLGPFVISGRTIFGTKSQAPAKEEQTLQLDFQSTKYRLMLRKVKEISLSDISNPDKQSSGVVFSFLNNMIRNFFHQMQYTEIGRTKKYFDPNSRKKLEGADVTVYRGYSTSFSLLENGLFLKVDPTVKIIQSQSALDVINKIYKRNATLSKTQKRLLIEEELIGKSVMANYGRNLCYRIQSVAFDINLENYQFTHQNKVINLIEYYNCTYDIPIKTKNQPLLRAQSTRNKGNSENNNEIILVPELILMNGLPEDFDERKRREISQLTIVNPSQKLQEIEDLFVQIGKADSDYNPQLIGDKLGIKFATAPAIISAKQLKFPQLQLGGKDRVQEHKATNFMLFNKNLFSRDVNLKLYIILPNDFDFAPIKSLLDSTAGNLGLQYKINTNAVSFKDTKVAMKAIETALKAECQSKNSNIFWFIIPPSFKMQYKLVKRMTLKNGLEINSQVTISTNLQKKGFQSIFTKILLQMAAKLGNKLWVPKISQKIAGSGSLLIGIQTTKDSEFKDKNVISYCSNNTKDFSSFYSNYIYDSCNSMKTHMKQIIFQCINDYLQKSQAPPTEVILIKNGTTKLDVGSLIQAEVQEIKDILKSVCKASECIRLTYIVLDKNASQKFFIEKGNDISNPISGTLVNAQAVGKNFEFYLIAQQCNRGTVKPTYYRVAYSDSQLQEGVIEELIYSQCFNYMNWTGSIKVPGTLQYAKKLGAFVGQYINKECNYESLNRNLYFI